MKKIFISVSIVFTLAISIYSANANQATSKTFLALGDSYTSGTSVDADERFAVQAVRLLVAQKILFSDPEIIAREGWTTNNLLLGMEVNRPKLETYDVVTLLIGVNNQYQHLALDIYPKEFTALLMKAISLAGNQKKHVIVLSIPDYSVTPFANGIDQVKTAKEINEYNAVNKKISNENGVQYIDITSSTRLAAKDASLVASDGLHPSGKEYAVWATKIATQINSLKP